MIPTLPVLKAMCTGVLPVNVVGYLVYHIYTSGWHWRPTEPRTYKTCHRHLERNNRADNCPHCPNNSRPPCCTRIQPSTRSSDCPSWLRWWACDADYVTQIWITLSLLSLRSFCLLYWEGNFASVEWWLGEDGCVTASYILEGCLDVLRKTSSKTGNVGVGTYIMEYFFVWDRRAAWIMGTSSGETSMETFLLWDLRGVWIDNLAVWMSSFRRCTIANFIKLNNFLESMHFFIYFSSISFLDLRFSSMIFWYFFL